MNIYSMDKAMADKVMYILNDDNNPIYKLQLAVETFEHSTN